MAMNRVVAKLSTLFTVDGLKSIQSQIQAFVGRVRSVLSSVARTPFTGLTAMAAGAKTFTSNFTSGLRTVGASIGGLSRSLFSLKGLVAGLVLSAPFVALRKAVGDAKDAILELDDVGDITGLKAEDLSALRIVAGKSGVDAPELENGLVNLAKSMQSARKDYNSAQKDFLKDRQDAVDAASDAFASATSAKAAGDLSGYTQSMHDYTDALHKAASAQPKFADTTQQFTDLNVAILDADGNYRNLIEVMKDVGVATRGMSDVDRTAALSDIFGVKNAKKLAGLLNDIDNASWADIKAQAKAEGPIITEEDIASAKRMQAATSALHGAWLSFKLDLFRAFFPVFLSNIQLATKLINDHRLAVVNGIVKAWNTATQFVLDFMHVVVGINSILGVPLANLPVRFQWLYGLKSFLDGLIGFAVQAARAIGVLAVAFDRFVKVKTGKSITEWLGSISVDGIVRALNYVRQVALDTWNVLIGHDFDVKTAIGRKFEQARDVVIGALKGIKDAIAPILAGIANAFQDVLDGLRSGNLDDVRSAWFNVGAAVSYAAGWLIGFIEALYKVVALNEQVDGQFSWMNDVVNSAKEAWKWFLDLYNAINGVLSLFGIDLRAVAFFISLIAITGVGGVLNLFAGLIGGILRGVGKLFGLFKEAKTVTTFGTGLAAAAESGAPMLVFLAALVAATTGVYVAFQKLEEATHFFSGITDFFAGVPQSLANLKAVGDQIYDQGGYLRDPNYKGPRVPGATLGIPRGAYAVPPPVSDSFQSLASGSAGSFMKSLDLSGLQPRETVNLNLNIAPGVSVPTKAEKSDVDKLAASIRNNPTLVLG